MRFGMKDKTTFVANKNLPSHLFHAFSLYKCVYCLPEHNVYFSVASRDIYGIWYIWYGGFRATYINLKLYNISKSEKSSNKNRVHSHSSHYATPQRTK